MTETAVTMRVRIIDPLTSAIDINGSVTRAAEATLMDAYHQASRPQTRTIILNFSDLDFMNSSGIGLLVTFLVRANRQAQTVYAYGLSQHYRDIFALTRLDEAIHLADDEPSALAAAHEGVGR